MERRVVITSIGIVSPLGRSPEDILKNFRRGLTAFSRSVTDGKTVTCPVEKFDLKAFTGPFKYNRYLNRGMQLGFAAATLAVKNSGLEKDELTDAGIFCGTGPNMDISGEFQTITNGRLDRPDLPALWILKFLPNTLCSVISQYFNIHGDNLTINNACAASLHSIGEAYRKIKHGYLKTALAGGGDSRINAGGILSYEKARALYSGTGDPDKAHRPFDKDRNGFVPGEGGAFFLLEELDHATNRNADILAEICGFGATIDGHSMTAPHPEGTFARDAVFSALTEAHMDAGNIEIISSHGTSTELNDLAEARIISESFSKTGTLVTALKSWIGHTAAACGALELALSLICMQNGYVPEIRNLITPCNKDINFVFNPVMNNLKTLLVQNFGFGGQNCALIIKKWE